MATKQATAQPTDFTAMARDYAERCGWRMKDPASTETGWRKVHESDLTKAFLAFAKEIATLSHAAGRAEGMEEAAKWHDGKVARAAILGEIFAGIHRRSAREIRALASSDPAPRDQVAEVDTRGAPLPPLDTLKGRRYYAVDSDGQWFYINHGNTWQTCPPIAPAPVDPGLAAQEVERVARVLQATSSNMGRGPDEKQPLDWPLQPGMAAYWRELAVVALSARTPAAWNVEAFKGWIRELDEDVIQDEYGYEDGEFTVYPDHWRPMFDEGLTPAQAFRRALDAHDEARREEDAARVPVLSGVDPGLAAQEVEQLRDALTEIDGWREHQLGGGLPATTQNEAFRRGCRMAFYRCSDRARAALSAPRPAQTKGPTE